MPIYTDYIAAAIIYNLQLLPESLITGIIILAIVLVSKTLLVLAAGAGLTQLLTSTVGKLITRFMEGSAMSDRKCADRCTPGFLGKAAIRLANGGQTPELLWHPVAPSVYLATVGYFVGVGLALLQIYKDEIDAKVVNRSTLTGTAIVSLIILVMAIVFRVSHGCETLFGAIGGILLGLLIGYLGCITIGYLTDRRATNVWGIPLIRDRINGGSALYVCPKQ